MNKLNYLFINPKQSSTTRQQAVTDMNLSNLCVLQQQAMLRQAIACETPPK